MTEKDNKKYIEKILYQRQEREERFRNSERGWLGLVGLYWLNEGENTIGSDKKNHIVLQSEAPLLIGKVQFKNGVATFHAHKGISVLCNGKQVQRKTLAADIFEDDVDYLQIGEITFVLLERGDYHLIRVWDKNSETRKSFTGFRQYAVNPYYRVKAEFTIYKNPKTIRIQDVIEIDHDEHYQGYVTFDLDGQKCRLEATAWDDYLFFSFSDKTNNDATNKGGRYLITKLPKDGKVVIDFNTAYNPPCAYTDFATCPLPPSQNYLNIKIEAGEKKYYLGQQTHK